MQPAGKTQPATPAKAQPKAQAMDLRGFQHRLRVVQSLRFTVLCAAIIIATALAGLSTGITTLVPAIVLVLFLKDETFASSLAWLAGVVLGAVFVFLNTYLFDQAWFIYLVLSMVLLFGLGYWTAQGIRGRWGYLAFPLGAAFTLLSAVFAEISGAPDGVAAAVLWVKETPLGLLVFWIVMIGLWPSPTARDLSHLVEATQRECATLLRASIDAVAAGRPTAFVPSPLTLRHFGELGRTLSVNAEKFLADPTRQETLRAKLDILSEAYVDIRYIQRSFEDLPSPGFDDQTRAAAAEIMTALAGFIDGRSLPDLTDAFETISRAERALSEAATDDDDALRLAARLAGFSVAAKSLQNKIAALETPLSAKTDVNEAASRPAPVLMTDSLQAAAKLIIGILLGLVIILLTDLPTNSYIVIAILVILAQPNVGRAHLRIRLWFPGVLAGSLWAVAGLFVLSYLPYFGIYLVWFLPGLFLAGYLGLGPDRISYAGMQLAMGLATILGMAAFPDDTLLSAEARVLGACIGFLIALAVYYVLWPSHPAVQLRVSLAANLREIATLLTCLSKIGTVPDEAPLRAHIQRRIVRLGTEVQADFGLLYDYSYMMTRKVRPAYDYRALLHAAGMMFSQAWCLQQAIATPAEAAKHETVLKPVRAAVRDLTATMNTLANRLERAQPANATEMMPMREDIRTELHKLRRERPAKTPAAAREDLDFGIDTVGLIWIHLQQFADAMDTSRAREPLTTAQLAELYEGASS